MDFLDPKKQRRQTMLLMVGYVLIGAGILIGSIVLYFLANGYSRGKNGQIIQNGFVFVSSQPHPAKIYVNGKPSKATNTRLTLPAGSYLLRLARNGYRDWQRQVTVLGGDVQHFDYPLLFPTKLTTSQVGSYKGVPGLAAQSPNQQWLVVQRPEAPSSFMLYNLKSQPVAATTITLPAEVVTASVNRQSWKVIDWADDNRHLLLQHTYGSSNEFILLDTQAPGQSVNLDKALGVDLQTVSLDNKKYNQYYLFDKATGELSTDKLGDKNPVARLRHVIAYKTYGTNVVLYATASGAPKGKVDIDLLDGSQTVIIRQAAAHTTYLLDYTTYSGTPYALVSAASESKVYIYKDPFSQLQSGSLKTAFAIRVFKISRPSYEAFSTNAQFIMAEGDGGRQIGVFDIENIRSYLYRIPALEKPQSHVTWMDGDRLAGVIGGKLTVFDYDHANAQTLMPASPRYEPFFRPDYHYAFVLAPLAKTKTEALTSTPLLTPADI